MIVSITLTPKQALELEKSVSQLPDYHIGKIFGTNCITECSKTGETIQVFMPVALQDYLLESGNAFDSVPGLIAVLLQQVDDHKNASTDLDDEYGRTVRCMFINDYEKVKRLINKYPEYHVVRVFFEEAVKKMRSGIFKIMVGKSQGTDYLGTDRLPDPKAAFKCYCWNELFSFCSKNEEELSKVFSRASYLTVDFFS